MAYEERTDVWAALRRALPFLSDPEPRRVETVEHTPAMPTRELTYLVAYHQSRPGITRRTG